MNADRPSFGLFEPQGIHIDFEISRLARLENSLGNVRCDTTTRNSNIGNLDGNGPRIVDGEVVVQHRPEGNVAEIMVERLRSAFESEQLVRPVVTLSRRGGRRSKP